MGIQKCVSNFFTSTKEENITFPPKSSLFHSLKCLYLALGFEITLKK